MGLPEYKIKSEGRWQYIVDYNNYKKYWLKDGYIYTPDGKTKLGHLTRRDNNWDNIIISGRTVAYVQK